MRRHFCPTRQLPLKDGPQAYPNNDSLLKLGDYLLAERASSQDPEYVRNQDMSEEGDPTLAWLGERPTPAIRQPESSLSLASANQSLPP